MCGAERNYTGYCNPEVDKLVDQQSMEADPEKRKKLVWEIERRLAEDAARPVIFYPRGGDLPAALGQGADDHGQQHLQRLALRRRLARQIAAARSAPAAARPTMPSSAYGRESVPASTGPQTTRREVNVMKRTSARARDQRVRC